MCNSIVAFAGTGFVLLYMGTENSNSLSPNQDVVLPTIVRTIVSRVTRGDERFVNFVNFMLTLYSLF